MTRILFSRCFVYLAAAGSSNWPVLVMTSFIRFKRRSCNHWTHTQSDDAWSYTILRVFTKWHAWTRGAKTVLMFWARIAGGALACQRLTAVLYLSCLLLVNFTDSHIQRKVLQYIESWMLLNSQFDLSKETQDLDSQDFKAHPPRMISSSIPAASQLLQPHKEKPGWKLWYPYCAHGM